MAEAFQSARLVYRAIEDNEEDIGLLNSLNQESEGRTNNSHAIFKPVNKKFSQQQAKNFEESFLCVLICLPISVQNDHSGSSPQYLEPIGRVGLWKIEENFRHHRSANIGIHILAAYQRKGYGSEAINWTLNWAFQMAGMHRVGIASVSYNPGALRLYERLGFAPEGRIRESIWYDGAWYDYVMLGMLENEWRLRQKKQTRVVGNIPTSTEW